MMEKKYTEEQIRKIYSCLVEDTEGKDRIGKEIDEEILKLTKDEKQQMDWQEYEQYRDKMFHIAFIAREGGFVEGFKYATLLMLEVFA